MPVVAIALQGACAIIIALTGTYAQVVNYVVAMDSLFFGLTAVCLFVLRRRRATSNFRVPGHPWTTLFFIAAQWLIVISTFANARRNSTRAGEILAGPILGRYSGHRRAIVFVGGNVQQFGVGTIRSRCPVFAT